MKMTLKISKIEAICLICIVMANQIILNMPRNIISAAGAAAWLNVVYISIIAILIVLFISKLFQKFVGKDILDISEYLGGKWLKIVVGISYIVMFVLISSTVLQYFSEKLKLIYFHNTPIVVIISIFLLGAVLVNRIGIKSLFQVNIVIVILLLISILLLILSTSHLFVYDNLFPVLGRSANDTFFSGLTNLFAFEGIAYLYFIMPILKNTKDFKKIAVISTIISSIYLFLSITSLILVFAYIYKTEEMLLIYFLTRIAEFGDFLQRTDALFVLLWILTVLSYTSIAMFFSTHIFKRITNLSNYKPLLYTFVLLMFGVALILTNIADSIHLQRTAYKYFQLILIFVMSLSILIGANIKKRIQKKDV